MEDIVKTCHEIQCILAQVEKMKKSQEKWDLRFLRLAKEISSYSLDPSTKAGAVIVDPSQRLISVGYNGFARGVNDDPERYADRDFKIGCIVHAEVNAIIFAKRDLTDCALYTWPFLCCSNCAGVVIQSGIKFCICPPMPEDKKERWAKSMDRAKLQFDEAGVDVCFLTEA